MGDPTKKLTDEFRSLLDETIILSISSDYELTNPQEFAAVREILLALSKDVEVEEATGFNPSGLGSNDLVDINPVNQDDSVETAGVAESDLKSTDGFTTTTTTESSGPRSLVSMASSKTSTREHQGLLHVGVFDGLSDSEKEDQLGQMFTSLKPIDVKLALQKANGDASIAIDELLNLQWLEQTGQRPKGIDGFYVSDDDVPNKKKKKGKRKKKVAKASALQGQGSSSTSEELTGNDEMHTDHIAFISGRLNIAVSEVTAIYRRHNDSLGATVVEILDRYIALNLQMSDPKLSLDVREQTDKFPWIPREYAHAAFGICPTGEYAVDVIHILADYCKKPLYVKYDVSYSIAPSDIPDMLDEPTVAPSTKQSSKTSSTARPSLLDAQRPVLRTQARSLEAATAASASLAASRNHSFTSAASAFRKGRSDPLFRHAAAFYATRAQEQAAAHRAASSAAAGFLVDRNSTGDTIDLHGVTVQDGIDIAIDRVWGWWEGLGEERARKARQGCGFTVVTGLGRHTADGRSRLRSSVFKALVADGWKVEVLSGSYLVTGRR
ncbi:hypothetical protein F4779DRAFT_376467 [Xylariaceae sp. FL0662B]|nr:hypothetical protein F4779DRAFT_376467 [Xylariaceae sp. FL0662B]